MFGLGAGGHFLTNMSPTHAAEPPVPVTAKLSKRFYDVLGEDVANELVDWFNAVDSRTANLRELNELNFARFDAKLEQRLAELRAELRTEFHAGCTRCGRRFAGANGTPTCTHRAPH